MTTILIFDFSTKDEVRDQVLRLKRVYPGPLSLLRLYKKPCFDWDFEFSEATEAEAFEWEFASTIVKMERAIEDGLTLLIEGCPVCLSEVGGVVRRFYEAFGALPLKLHETDTSNF